MCVRARVFVPYTVLHQISLPLANTVRNVRHFVEYDPQQREGCKRKEKAPWQVPRQMIGLYVFHNDLHVVIPSWKDFQMSQPGADKDNKSYTLS